MKRLFALLTALVFLFLFSVNSFASGGEYLVDDADLLDHSEEMMLLQEIEEISNNHGISVVVHTTDYTCGKDIATYADDFYDNGGYLADGLVFVINMAERDYFTSTAGYLVDSLTAYDLEIICEDIVPCLSNGDYYKAFSQYLSQLDLFLNGQLDNYDDFVFAGDYYNSGNEYYVDDYYADNNYHVDISSDSNLFFREVILIAVALIAAFAITSFLKSKMNTAVKKYDADDYVVNGSFNLNLQKDAFIGSTVTKRPLPKNNNNGGVSRGGSGGVRVSSGGVRHGGGGGKF